MSESEQLRLFIAIAIPEEVQAKVAAAQAELRRVLPERVARWTRREQFHLTLRFLGDVAASRVEALSDALRAACQGFPALRLRAQRVGFFPDLRFPRVAWIGVTDQENQLPRLQAAVDAATKDFTAEKPGERFTGHVTLARIKGIRRPEAEALAQAAAGMTERLFGQWTAHKIELMRSELSPKGARHTCLAATRLDGTPGNLE
jgi:RNA 2',3'-cyclic 3'-phosphodiesterase